MFKVNDKKSEKKKDKSVSVVFVAFGPPTAFSMAVPWVLTGTHQFVVGVVVKSCARGGVMREQSVDC